MIRVLCLGLSRSYEILIVTYCRGPYFKDYFDQPTRAQIGTMVAILEVGAFCTLYLETQLMQFPRSQLVESVTLSVASELSGMEH